MKHRAFSYSVVIEASVTRERKKKKTKLSLFIQEIIFLLIETKLTL